VAFTEELSQFFDTDEHAVAAVVRNKAGATVRTINVILETPQQNVAIFDAEVEAGVPLAHCATADLAGVAHGYTLTIGADVYVIVTHTSDGTGVSTVNLRKQ
jgi:hypothetical protein